MSYEDNRAYVLSVLAHRCSWIDPSDREALFHDAYIVALEKQRDGRLSLDAMHDAQQRAYLVQTALNKAMDESKRAGRRRTVHMADDCEYADDECPSPDEQLDASMDSARVREIVSELPERQRAIVKLRFYFNRTPAEIQSHLGLTERCYRRELERAMRQVAERYDLVRSGRFCESRRSVILAFVSGVAGPRRTAAARAHLATCPSCAHWAGEGRHRRSRWAEGLKDCPVGRC